MFQCNLLNGCPYFHFFLGRIPLHWQPDCTNGSRQIPTERQTSMSLATSKSENAPKVGADMLVAPQEISETGVRKGLLEDLALKILYLNGEMSLVDISKSMCVSMGVIEQLCEVKGMTGGTHRITASAQGKVRAGELLTLSQYAGPAPVSLDDYTKRVRTQSVQGAAVQPADLARAFQTLIIDTATLSRLGTAVVSGSSIFLYGPAGTGKTSIAVAIPAIYNDNVWIPHAVEVDNQIITVFDPGVHRPSGTPYSEESDTRWILCDRPRVVAGGELSAEMLDLQFSSASRFYTAPLQMKANNGVLVLDDFGRQRMRADELLNRWMTPLDRRIDFLSLPGGRKFEIPFDLFVAFSTNLDPRQLADEAFLRRIPNKIQIGYATREQFIEIFNSKCAMQSLPCDPGLPEFLAQHITQDLKEPLRHCYTRDIIDQIFWSAAFLRVEARATRDTVLQACQNYFLPTGTGSKPQN